MQKIPPRKSLQMTTTTEISSMTDKTYVLHDHDFNIHVITMTLSVFRENFITDTGIIIEVQHHMRAAYTINALYSLLLPCYKKRLDVCKVYPLIVLLAILFSMYADMYVMEG